ncbi:MAG TPA: LytTR family DNA-binding domain-containing protein [Flavisolibacter sp.]
MIKVIIIDDEPSAVDVISMILQMTAKDDVEILATSNSPEEGLQLIRTLKPDLVFLDVEMPGTTGIELVRSVNDPNLRVVFITAHDAYAVEAFRLRALNYLLKPVEADDLATIIDRVKKDISAGENTVLQQLINLERMMQQKNSLQETKIAIGMSDKIVFVTINDIIYCEASGTYTNIFLKDGAKMTSSKTLGDFQSQLERQKFFRIHHSHLINLNRVKEYQRHDGGYVIMENSKQLEVSHRKRKEFLMAIDEMMV